MSISTRKKSSILENIYLITGKKDKFSWNKAFSIDSCIRMIYKYVEISKISLWITTAIDMHHINLFTIYIMLQDILRVYIF